jgi:hypothetical protein
MWNPPFAAVYRKIVRKRTVKPENIEESSEVRAKYGARFAV